MTNLQLQIQKIPGSWRFVWNLTKQNHSFTSATEANLLLHYIDFTLHCIKIVSSLQGSYLYNTLKIRFLDKP